jgi:D-sedoheptulose 7-phosphate isomerase|tara:strand:+ start:1165 stop:1743 length:579 start_codon:yes stop_codon:yes gene_type:complete
MKINQKLIKKNLLDIENNFKNLNDKYYLDLIQNAASMIVNSIKNKKKIIFCGNGGSAADGEHLCAELAGRYLKKRKAYPAIALTGNSSLITALANDYGFENIFYRQIESIGEKGDILFAITTSGKSKNILNILQLAKKKGIKVILLTSMKAKNLKNKVDLIIPVPSERVDRIQEMHIGIGHIICETVENCIN